MAMSQAIAQCVAQPEAGRQAFSIDAFRARLGQLILTECEGKYTLLARRAGIPISTMQHYIHWAKRIPGGEHVARIAHALGVTTDFLISGCIR